MSKMLLKILARKRDRVHSWVKKRLSEIELMELQSIISRRDAVAMRRSINGLARRTQGEIDTTLAKFGKPW